MGVPIFPNLSASNLVSVDIDHDGLPDTLNSSAGCYGDNLPAGYAYTETVIDSRIGTTATENKDTNWDGIGDVCTADLENSNSKYLQEAVLRQFLSMNSKAYDKCGAKSERLTLQIIGKLLKLS